MQIYVYFLDRASLFIGFSYVSFEMKLPLANVRT